MNRTVKSIFFQQVRAALAVSALGLAAAAHAENHALIMWIGEYSRAGANLPGIDLDAKMARTMALAMGVPPGNVREVSNGMLTKQGVADALADLTRRIAQDDKVFIYYSGHGSQRDGSDGSKCTEGLVTHELTLYEDFRMEAALNALGTKAGQVVMMNDSCFSGGAATKALPTAPPELVPKFLPAEAKAGSVNDADYQCGSAVNSKMARTLETVGAAKRAPQVLYIAAAAANEVSYASKRGSVGTLAWASCLADADTNRSGAVDGNELRACAQKFINDNNGRQTITLVGNTRLPLFFPPTNSAGAGAGTAPVVAVQTLEDIRAGRDPSVQVRLSTARSSLRIRQDPLDFSVSINQPGYLYIVQVGSDGQTFNLLFPNSQDAENQLPAGTHRFPRPSWRVQAGGPAGTSYMMAILTANRIDLGKGMDLSGVFGTQKATRSAARTLEVSATGRSGRSGVSEIVPVDEVN